MPSDGIRVELRMIVEHPAERRWDVNGVELLQIRGHAVDAQRTHPELVVRFAGERQAQLARWCAPGKHLAVIGQLEVKSWTAVNGVLRIVLLIEASDIHPLNPDEVDHSREGVYAALGRTARMSAAPPPPKSKTERADRMRRLMADA